MPALPFVPGQNSAADAAQQPVGSALPHFHGCPFPSARVLAGTWCQLEPLTSAHVPELYDAFAASPATLWTYMPYGPFADAAALEAHVLRFGANTDTQSFAVRNLAGKAVGMLSLMRIAPEMGCVEVGAIAYSSALQDSAASTEAVVLLARYVFGLGYRRFEWKCDALNQPSRNAAERLGFRFEGVFRQHMVLKGRNRDTAWYSMLDGEWPSRAQEFERWLAPENFSAEGVQLSRLRRIEA